MVMVRIMPTTVRLHIDQTFVEGVEFHTLPFFFPNFSYNHPIKSLVHSFSLDSIPPGVSSSSASVAVTIPILIAMGLGSPAAFGPSRGERLRISLPPALSLRLTR